MRPLPSLLLALTLACSGGSNTPVDQRDDSGGADGADGGTDGADGGSGTDADGDGFTVEEGDCDDSDIGVNPAREEDLFDGVDNDCDGRVDEEWSGYTVAEQIEGGTSRLLIFDTIARLDDTIDLPAGAVPYDLDHGLSDNYVVVLNEAFHNISAGGASFQYAPTAVAEVGLDGSVSVLATYTDPAAENSDPSDDTFHWFGAVVRGVATHPDGYYVVLRRGDLIRLNADGTQETLAEWQWDFNEEGFELHAQALSIDLLTGEVAVLGLLGGFATWSADGGFAVQRQVDLESWDYTSGVAAARMGADGWRFMLGNFDTGAYAIYGWDAAAGDFERQLEWANNRVAPLGLAEDGDHDELYATAKGGDYRTIWRIRYLDETVDDAYGEVDDGATLWGIVSNY